MSENKRFNRLISSIDYYYCIDKENDEKGLTEADMLNMLNDLSDENRQLKKENEKLKNVNKSLSDFRNFTNIEHIRTKDENEQLKKALFFYLDIVLSESLTDSDKWCNLLFDCNYEEAKRNYDDFEYKEKWESE